ncbi:hypothetical protein NEMBOFW57_004906 [Staphylotrichum longicolle]|uniref:Uncharacterized protein n=1 Tax=Staphylotrichum longicolle TaxID=669026 RepID=A0AAD4EVT8_9PEZI|nr:hypothetical protein NEMBOFW57_004906 [Staphylotrichum longicolle]
MVTFTRAVVVGWLLAGAAAVAHERFVAVETGAVLSPRLYHMSPALPLLKRQNGCDCIIDPKDTSKGGCCHIGSTCDSPCAESQYQCNKTTTTTLTSGATPVTTLVPACCPRTCTGASEFHCPAVSGTSTGRGGCCAYGARCGAAGQCLFTPAPTTSLDLSLAPPGCTTGQISCAATLGGGCCAATQSCTLIDAKAHCADNPITPTGSGVSVVNADETWGGLSAGAKAGIAVGVVVGAGLVMGAATWWCLRRRRAGRGEGGSSSARTRPGAGVMGRVVGGGLGGLAQDYFGPAPAVGPYSDTHTTSAVTTPGLERGGVPLQPHEPGDIAVPVEIDSRLREARRVPEGLAITPGGSGSPGDDEDGHQRFELYGSEVGQISPTLPSPYAGGLLPSPDERPGRH